MLNRASQACVEVEAKGDMRGFDLGDLCSIHSVPRLFGSTAGPFPGIGGAAMAWYQLTVVYSDRVLVLFAKDRLYGVAPLDAEVLMHLDPDDSPTRRCRHRTVKCCMPS